MKSTREQLINQSKSKDEIDIIKHNKYNHIWVQASLLQRMVYVNHELVDESPHHPAHVGQQPGDPEPGLSSLGGRIGLNV